MSSQVTSQADEAPAFSGFETAYARERDRLLVERMRLLGAIAAPILASFWALDLLTAPEHAVYFGLLRLIAIAILVALRLYVAPGRPLNLAFSVAAMLGGAVGMSVMTAKTGNFTSNYVFGLVQVFMVVGFFIPWRVSVSIGVSAAMLLSYFGVNASALDTSRPVLTMAFALSGIASLQCVANAVGENARRRDFRMRLEIEQANEKLIELDLAKTRFFANVSHELRTPLTLMLAPIEAILEEPGMPAGSRQHMLEICRQNGMRLLRLVDDLLSLSRVEAGRLRLRSEQIDLSAVATAVVREMTPWAERKGVGLELIDEIHGTAHIHGDLEYVDRALLNLVGNALKFTQSGQIRIKLENVDAGVQVEVSDTGIGIPADQLPQVFERFHQVDASSTRRFGGTGIGLALTREIVELHGGRIEVESALGSGTTFRFNLPHESRLPDDAIERRRRPSADITVERRTAERGLAEWHDSLRARDDYRLAGIVERGPAAFDDQTRPSTAAPCLLIVDDNPDMVDLLRGMLSGEYAVLAAEDAAAGLAIAKEKRPDIILSDVMMPGMNGFELVQRLRQDERTTEIPVALLTARGEVDDRIAGRTTGADAYLTKPFQPKELHATLRGLLQAHDRHVEAARDERDEAMRVLAAGVAHEVLNPLGFIRSALVATREAADELRQNLKDEEQRAAIGADLERLYRSGEEGVRRVRLAVAELQRFAHGGRPAPLQPTTLTSIATSVLSLVGSDELRSATETDLQATRTISTRPGQIEQVVLNLMLNAYQAGGETTTITLRSADEGEGVVLAVQDTGPGISPDQLEEVFNPFYTTKAPGKGTGLGLSVSRQIVRQHGGSLTVESVPGRGTTFYVRLPAAIENAGSGGAATS
jgi:signal transduction histidine kinase